MTRDLAQKKEKPHGKTGTAEFKLEIIALANGEELQITSETQQNKAVFD